MQSFTEGLLSGCLVQTDAATSKELRSYYGCLHA